MAQQQNNYFTSNIRRWNREDFLWQMKPEQIQKDAKNRIFREMVKGQIDYSQFGNYYLDPKFLENLIISANNELTNNIVVARALEFYDINFPGDANVTTNRMKHNGLCNIYSTLLQRLNAVKQTQDIGYLTDIQYVLSEYKNYI